MSVRIVSYNLLVPTYATESDYYFKSNPEYLQTDYRWNLIKSQLEKEMNRHRNTIICLQELSFTYLSRLFLFFHENNYTLYQHCYGHRGSDYMGVGIALPNSIKVNSVRFENVGGYLKSINKPLKRENSWLYKIWNYIFKQTVFSPVDKWETAMNRSNTLIFVEVSFENKSLCIGTYHMPCMYQEPNIMTIHAFAVKDLMFKLSSGKDFILAGDFNLEPTSSNYLALIGQNTTDVALPTSNIYQINYYLNTDQVLKSAYLEKNGQEPFYTNYAHTSKSPKFCATLDYIFFVGNLIVEQVLELPDHPTGESYPDKSHPSDHLMIAATFRL